LQCDRTSLILKNDSNAKCRSNMFQSLNISGCLYYNIGNFYDIYFYDINVNKKTMHIILNIKK